MLEYAEIDKDTILFAYNQQVEIWAKDKYEDFITGDGDEYSELAEQVLGNVLPDPAKFLEN